MTKEACLAILDIGTAKTVALVLRAGEETEPYILGSGLSATVGLQRGKIVDQQSIAASIRSALRQAEENAGCRADDLFCAVSGAEVKILFNRGSTANGKENKTIQQEDVDRAFVASKVLAVDSGQEVIHAVPQRFYVDGQAVSDIVSQQGLRLEVDTAIVAGAARELSELADIINNLGTASLKGWVYGGSAMASCSLSAEEQKQPVLLMDLGAGTVDVTLVCRQQPYYAAMLPIAGNHLTGDLSIGLGIGLDQAEQLKTDYGTAMADMSKAKNTASFSDIKPNIPRPMIAEIIEARLQEIFTLIKDDIRRAGYQIPASVVIYGGTAELTGIGQMLNRLWGASVRIATPPKVKGLPVNFYSPAFTNVAAISIFAASEMEYPLKNQRKNKQQDFFARFSRLWQSFSGR